MFDVVCIGNALVDITLKVPDSFIKQLGLKKGSMTLTNEYSQKELLTAINVFSSKLSTGGSSANVSLGIACLGGKSAFIGKKGKDIHGSFFESALISKKVNPVLSESINLNTGTAITLITNDGERTFSTHLGASSSLNKDDLLKIPKTKFLHIEAYLLENPVIKEAILWVVEKAKLKGTKISLDLSDSSLIQRIKPVLIDFLKYVDVVFANEEEAKTFTGEKPLNAARALSNVCEIAVVKLSDKGSIVVSGNIQEFIEIEAVKPVNTNGAGDAYAAGFLFGLCNDFDLFSAGELASLIAKEVVQVETASLDFSLKDKIQMFFDE